MKKIKGYEPIKQIGTGGFGEVYVAKQDVINREVAIKVILPLYANRDDFIRRFQFEAELVARLEHPHIVPLYDYWRDPSGAYLVMRYIKGGNLADRLVTDGAMEPSDAARLLEQIAGALHTAHRNKVIHQDIKPANILLDEDGNAYLTDFGIARDIESNVNLAEDESNTMHGSPKYISPEHLRRKEITPRSDIYSLGLLMYELLTGKPPFEHDDMLQLLQMHVRKDLPSLQLNSPNLPEALNYPLQQATLKDPLARYESVLQFARDFQAVVAAQGHDQTSTIAFPSTWSTGATGPIEIRNPYKGLKAFKEADAEDFYGREELVKSLIRSMTYRGKMGRFLAVVGPSGSGKSSVVRAGLIPAVRSGEIMGLPTQYITTMIPGSNPMRSLEGAILKVASRASVKLMETISRETYDLNEVLKSALPENGEMLLLLDQFEEIFTLVPTEEKRRLFLDLIYDALMVEDSRLRVIATLRADFLDKPLAYAEWGELFRERLELIPAMTQAELRASIEEPALQNGLSFEAGLVGIIMADVNSQVGVLPLLQYTLSELYERRNGVELTVEAYEEMGGISGALAQRADEIYNTLDAEQQDIARILFTRIVRVGEGEDHTRQRVLLEDIYSIDRDESMIRTTVDTFGKYRLLTFDNETGSRQPTIEIAHEALIRSWELLQGWISENIDALRLQARLSTETTQWEDQGKEADYLASGLRLQQFTPLKDNDIIALTQREQAFLNASIKADEDRTRREKARQRFVQILQTAVAIAGVVAIIFAVFAVIQRNRAVVAREAEAEARQEAEDALEAEQIALAAEAEARQQADDNARESRARELAASSLLFAEDAPDRAMLLSLESLAIQDTFEGRNALLSSMLTQARLSRYFNGFDSSIRAVETSQDGVLLAAGTDSGIITLFDRVSGSVLHTLTAHEDRVNVLTFNPDSSLMASADLLGNIIIWNTESGEIVSELSINSEEVRALAFSPDGENLVAGNSQGEIIWWSVNTSTTQEGFIEAHSGEVIYDLVFSPDGTMMATGGADNTIHLWDYDNGLSLRTIITGHTNWVTTLDFSANSQLLASGSFDRSVRVWNASSGEFVWGFINHPREIFALTFDQTGRILITSDLDGNMVLWNAVATENNVLDEFRTFPPFSVRELTSIGNKLYVAGDNTALLELNIGFEPRFGTTVARMTEDILTTAISEDGTIAYAGGSSTGSDFSIYLLAPGSEEPVALELHSNQVTDLEWQGNRLISVSVDGQVGIWSDGELVDVINAGNAIFSVSAHDNMIALALNNWSIELWSIEGEPGSWSLIRTLQGHTNRVNAVEFSPDGSRLVSGSLDETVILWDTATGEIIGEPLTNHTNSVETVRFSPSGNIFASGSRDTTIVLYDALTGNLIGPPLIAHENWVNDIAFSPDGERMVSVSTDRSVILWNIGAQRMLGLPFIGHSAAVNSVSYSDDGTFIVTAGLGGNVIQWQASLDIWRESACQIVNRDLSDGEIRDFFNEAYPPENSCSVGE